MSPKLDIYQDALLLVAKLSQKWLELPDGPTDPGAVVDHLVENARLMTKGFAEIEGCTVLNEMAFKQVSFAFESDARTGFPALTSYGRTLRFSHPFVIDF